MVKGLVYAGIVIVALIPAVVVTGYALPQDHVASVSGVSTAPPAIVFARITNVAQLSTWRSDVEQVEILSRAPLTWREHAGGDVITYEMVEQVPAQRVVTRIADPNLPFGGTWTYELQPEGTGTRVTITERGEVYNPVFRFVSRFVIGHTATLEKVLAALVK